MTHDFGVKVPTNSADFPFQTISNCEDDDSFYVTVKTQS